MGGLRQVNKIETIPEETDVEAARDKPKFVKKTSSAVDDGSIHNPIFLVKVIFRKVYALISTDDHDASLAGLVISLVRDVVIGAIMAIICISLLIFLDHRNVIHYQSAHSFRDTAFSMLNDPETLATLEESTDMHYLTMDDYEHRKKEIETAVGQLSERVPMLETRTKEAEDNQKEIDALMDEHTNLRKSPLLGLDEYCGECFWKGKMTCDNRVNFLKDRYGTAKIEGKLDAMEHESCKKGAKEGDDKQKDNKQEEYVLTDENKKLLEKYCGECTWKGNMTCDNRVNFLKDRYGTAKVEGQLDAMEHDSCKKGAKEAEKKQKEYVLTDENKKLLEKYCGGCMWKGTTTCDGRVVYLKGKYGTGEIDGQIAAMEHPSCKKD